MDNKLEKAINKINNKNSGDESTFPEFSFLATCLKIDLTINDLKKLTYVEVMKIIVSYLDFQKENIKENFEVREATQADIDRFLGG